MRLALHGSYRKADANGPGTPTWSNYVMDSGCKVRMGKTMLPSLSLQAGHARALERYRRARRTFQQRHDDHRIWCEADGLFDRFVSVAGPHRQSLIRTRFHPVSAEAQNPIGPS